MARLTRKDWVEAAYGRATTNAEDLLTVDSLCEQLEATKGSFYHHFKDRGDLLMELEVRRDAMLAEIAETAAEVEDPADRFRTYCIEAFSSREYLNLEAVLERERVNLRDVDKMMQQADVAAYEWQLAAVKGLGYSMEDAPRFLRVLKAASMGLVFFLMHEGVALPLDERIEFANTLADLAVAGARPEDPC